MRGFGPRAGSELVSALRACLSPRVLPTCLLSLLTCTLASTPRLAVSPAAEKDSERPCGEWHSHNFHRGHVGGVLTGYGEGVRTGIDRERGAETIAGSGIQAVLLTFTVYLLSLSEWLSRVGQHRRDFPLLFFVAFGFWGALGIHVF